MGFLLFPIWLWGSAITCFFLGQLSLRTFILILRTQCFLMKIDAERNVCNRCLRFIPIATKMAQVKEFLDAEPCSRD